MREKGRSEWDILPGRGQALWRPLCLLPLISNQAKASVTSQLFQGSVVVEGTDRVLVTRICGID
ncbi:hypothetical protein CUMW_120260, partial [Citrus unshiu]